MYSRYPSDPRVWPHDCDLGVLSVCLQIRSHVFHLYTWCISVSKNQCFKSLICTRWRSTWICLPFNNRRTLAPIDLKLDWGYEGEIPIDNGRRNISNMAIMNLIWNVTFWASLTLPLSFHTFYVLLSVKITRHFHLNDIIEGRDWASGRQFLNLACVHCVELASRFRECVRI